MSSRPGRQTRSRLLPVVVIFGLLIVPFVARAVSIDDISQNVVSFVSLHVIYPVVQLLGNLLVALINIMVAVAAYNDFIHATAVEKGFIIVRDLSNMFFIIVLLIIAFGTVLNIQQYRYNRLLGRLILMAFLVNYARFIAGIFIDAAQVVMLTFVNSFRQAAAGNLTTAFGIEKLLALRRDKANPNPISGYELVGASLLALALVLIACVVIGVYVVVLLTRIIALWMLIILSPLAYVLRTFPAGQKYASEWWSNFSKYVICGPVMAFFLWLSLTVVAVSNSDQTKPLLDVDLNRGELQSNSGAGSSLLGDVGSTAATDIAATVSEISSSDNLLKYMVAILLMVGSMMVAQQLCGAAGRFAGEWSGKAINAAKFATGVTAAATALGYGRKKVQEGWELTKGGGKALAGALPGRAVRWLDYNAPYLNPAGLLRGWRAARDEKSSRAREHATDVATRYAQQVQTSVLGEIPLTKSWWKRVVDPRKWGGQLELPHEQRSDLKAISQIKSDLGPLEKREIAQKSWEMQEMGGADGDFYRVATDSMAAQESYMDDLMYHPQVRAALKKEYPDLFGSHKMTDEVTGEELTVEDEYYGPAQLSAYLHWKHRNSGKRIVQTNIDLMGEVGRKSGHMEYEGQNLFDEDKREHRFVDVVNSDGTINEKEENLQAQEAVGELIKQAPQDIAGLQIDSYISRRIQKVLNWAKGPDQGKVATNPDGSDKTRVTGGSMQKMHKLIFAKMTGLAANDMIRRIKPRLFEWMFGSADQIDEDGFLNVDEVTFSNIAKTIEENPRLMRIFWQQTAPAKHQTAIKVRAWDGQGNIAKIGAGKWKGKNKQVAFDLTKRKGFDFAEDTGPQTPRGLDYYFTGGKGTITPDGRIRGYDEGDEPGGSPGGGSGNPIPSGKPGDPGWTPPSPEGNPPVPPTPGGGGSAGGGTPGATPPGGGGGRAGRSRGRRGGGRTGGGVGTAAAAAVAGAAVVAAANARGRGPDRPPVAAVVASESGQIKPTIQTPTGRAVEVRDSLSSEIARLEQQRQEAAAAGRGWEVASLETEIAERKKVVAAAEAMAKPVAAQPPSKIQEQIRAAQGEVDTLVAEEARINNEYRAAVKARDPRATELLEARQKARIERDSAMERLNGLSDEEDYKRATQPPVQPQPKASPASPPQTPTASTKQEQEALVGRVVQSAGGILNTSLPKSLSKTGSAGFQVVVDEKRVLTSDKDLGEGRTMSEATKDVLAQAFGEEVRGGDTRHEMDKHHVTEVVDFAPVMENVYEDVEVAERKGLRGLAGQKTKRMERRLKGQRQVLHSEAVSGGAAEPAVALSYEASGGDNHGVYRDYSERAGQVFQARLVLPKSVADALQREMQTDPEVLHRVIDQYATTQGGIPEQAWYQGNADTRHPLRPNYEEWKRTGAKILMSGLPGGPKLIDQGAKPPVTPVGPQQAIPAQTAAASPQPQPKATPAQPAVKPVTPSAPTASAQPQPAPAVPPPAQPAPSPKPTPSTIVPSAPTTAAGPYTEATYPIPAKAKPQPEPVAETPLSREALAADEDFKSATEILRGRQQSHEALLAKLAGTLTEGDRTLVEQQRQAAETALHQAEATFESARAKFNQTFHTEAIATKAPGGAQPAAGTPREPGEVKSMEEHLAELSAAVAGGMDELKNRVGESNKSLSALNDLMKQFAEKGSSAAVQGLQDQVGQFRRFLEQMRSGSPVGDDDYKEFVRKFREFLEEFRRYSDKLNKAPLPSVGAKTKDQDDQDEGGTGSAPRRPRPPQPPRPAEPTSIIPPAKAA